MQDEYLDTDNSPGAFVENLVSGGYAEGHRLIGGKGEGSDRGRERVAGMQGPCEGAEVSD